uniref:Uncharacterized protein n=1 Tax=Chromera velia CCMP2878 TaxID=1169474 RepID=A0A0G4H822_9ALVE|eukprot:Cvel_25092.t1-p1 / transcript=Cvel_25092.t1 / gene=Cvel_25092 / organism=Chromera_velia_CCMP2878 / gene_product=hypothetical protein / transcript_product=hypothetical protein / location=Cvel_scaffold2797:4501-4869(+) / protein_length=123 / sequence_SO=supercontig / SO=protein_coding / is_pseudo=false
MCVYGGRIGFFRGAAAGWKGAASGFSEERIQDWVEGMLREGGGFAVCASAEWGEVLIGVGLGRGPGSRLSVRRADSYSGGALWMVVLGGGRWRWGCMCMRGEGEGAASGGPAVFRFVKVSVVP